MPIESAGPGVGMRCACHCLATTPRFGAGAAGEAGGAGAPASIASKVHNSAAVFTGDQHSEAKLLCAPAFVASQATRRVSLTLVSPYVTYSYK